MMRMLSPAMLLLALPVASAFRLHAPLNVARNAGRASQPLCVAASKEDKELLDAAKKVTLAAKKFGVSQGKAAQEWVEAAIKGGDARAESLMGMQLALFEECQLDDGGKCKDLSAGIEALTLAVAEKAVEKPKKGVSFTFGASPIQAAATKIRAAASKFGPDQKKAADEWIKRVAEGKTADARNLLEARISLFGECLLSEDGTPSNCQKLDEALDELQLALESAGVSAPYVYKGKGVRGVVVPTAPADAAAAQDKIARLARGGF